MVKLFNLKEWLTVADTARHLSIVCGEDVTASDVLQLGLRGHLRLSVYLVNRCYARRMKPRPSGKRESLPVIALPEHVMRLGAEEIYGIDWEDVVVKHASNPDIYENHHTKISPEGLEFDSDILTIDGCWDLPMIGSERLSVRQEYQKQTGHPIENKSADAAFVASLDGTVWKLLERLERASNVVNKPTNRIQLRPYSSAITLPTDSVLVVRIDALREFEQSITGTSVQIDAPLLTKERNTLLTIIAALCDYSAIKHQERGVAKKIVAMTEEIGASVSDDTMRKVLSQIPDALGTRMK